jgi:hypothetical protein
MSKVRQTTTDENVGASRTFLPGGARHPAGRGNDTRGDGMNRTRIDDAGEPRLAGTILLTMGSAAATEVAP